MTPPWINLLFQYYIMPLYALFLVLLLVWAVVIVIKCIIADVKGKGL